MNIFVLDEQPQIAAAYHCDKHVSKMLIESAQMLSTCWHVLAPDTIRVESTGFVIVRTGARLYKPFQPTHPCSKWVRRSVANYAWLHKLACGLAAEYRLRYRSEHATSELLHGLRNAPLAITYEDLTPFEQCMPDKYRGDDAVRAYREYYVREKARFATWKNAAIPFWFPGV